MSGMSSLREGLSSKLYRVVLWPTGMSSLREGLSSKLCEGRIMSDWDV